MTDLVTDAERKAAYKACNCEPGTLVAIDIDLALEAAARVRDNDALWLADMKLRDRRARLAAREFVNSGVIKFVPEEPNVRPFDLKTMAASVSRTYGDKGAIIIASGADGVRIGVHGLDLNESKDALCVAIYSIVSKALA